MRVIFIGDIHGRSLWKEIVEKEKSADIVVFYGDFFDSKEHIGGEAQLQNFLEIITFKKNQEKLGEKVVLLFGNHDGTAGDALRLRGSHEGRPRPRQGGSDEGDEGDRGDDGCRAPTPTRSVAVVPTAVSLTHLITVTRAPRCLVNPPLPAYRVEGDCTSRG